MDRTAKIFIGYVVLFVASACAQTYRVWALRRKGQTWKEAFANTNKLMTGDVWRDATVFTAIILLVIGGLFILIWH